MAKTYLCFVALLLLTKLYSQKTPKDFGYQHRQLVMAKDTIHILIKSKVGEEKHRKPLFFEVQGSTAVPLVVHDGTSLASSVSILEGYVEEDYHLVLINKPGLPLICHEDELTRGKYKDQITKKYPQSYLENNNLEYYVARNHFVLEYLKKQPWADTTQIVVAGHSEGSSIAAYMVDKIEGITHLIYSGGLPYYSRILAMIQQERQNEGSEKNPWVEKTYKYWRDVVSHPHSLTRNKGWNTNRGTYSFSKSENEILKRLKVPILISYGTKDESAPFNDMLHIETIKDQCPNFRFNAYPRLNHNYVKILDDGTPDFKTDHLSVVVQDWLDWLKVVSD